MSNIVEDVEKETAEVGRLARMVVAKRVLVVTVVTVILQVLIAYHIITPDISSHVQTYLKDALDALGAVVAIFYIQKGVTPVTDPRNNAGTPLVPVTRAQALIENAKYESELPSAEPAVEHEV